MIKTSTQKPNNTNLKSNFSNEEDGFMDNVLITDSFYQTIKPALNKLVKDPSQETINKILAYAKRK